MNPVQRFWFFLSLAMTSLQKLDLALVYRYVFKIGFHHNPDLA